MAFKFLNSNKILSLLLLWSYSSFGQFVNDIEYKNVTQNLYQDDQSFLGIIQANDEHYLTAGYWGGEVHLAKYDRRGLDLLWEKKLFPGTAHHIYPANHNYGIAGQVNGKFFISRVDEAGNVLKKKVFSDIPWNKVNVKSNDESIVVSYDSAIIQFDFSGNVKKSYVKQRMDFEGAYKVDDGIIAWGINKNDNIPYIIKYSFSFNRVWMSKLGSVNVVDVTSSSVNGKIGVLAIRQAYPYRRILKIYDHLGNKETHNKISPNSTYRSIRPVLESDEFYLLKGHNYCWSGDCYMMGRIVISKDLGYNIGPINGMQGKALDIVEYAPGEIIALYQDGSWMTGESNASKTWNKIVKHTLCDFAPKMKYEIKCNSSVDLSSAYHKRYEGTYNWYKDGFFYESTTRNNLIIRDPGSYSYSIYACDTEIHSNEIELTQSNIDQGCSGRSSKVDVDGYSTLSVNANSYPTAYPNPAIDYLRLNGVKVSELIKVISVTGSTIKSMKYEGNPIAISELKPGIYFLVIERKNSAMKYIRFIKE